MEGGNAMDRREQQVIAQLETELRDQLSTFRRRAETNVRQQAAHFSNSLAFPSSDSRDSPHVRGSPLPHDGLDHCQHVSEEVAQSVFSDREVVEAREILARVQQFAA